MNGVGSNGSNGLGVGLINWGRGLPSQFSQNFATHIMSQKLPDFRNQEIQPRLSQPRNLAATFATKVESARLRKRRD